jgi:nickel-type superoxide dismutase maturation protease
VIQFLKVTGESLSPFFQAGDYVLVVKFSRVLDHLKAGDVVVFRQPGYGTLIKRIETILPAEKAFYVLGTHPESTDSRAFGAVKRSNIIGKVVWHIPAAH